MMIQLIGLVVLGSGLWAHHSQQILVGFSLVLLGHIFGWDKVSPHFE
jgi:hypothetical protein